MGSSDGTKKQFHSSDPSGRLLVVTAPVSAGIVYIRAALGSDRLLSSKYTQIHSILPRGVSQKLLLSPFLPCNVKLEKGKERWTAAPSF